MVLGTALRKTGDGKGACALVTTELRVDQSPQLWSEEISGKGLQEGWPPEAD